MTRSKSRYLYGRREASARSRFLKELASEIELPKEEQRPKFGYDSWDDPESYGNSAYGGSRYGSNDDYGKRNSYGASYGSYGGYSDSSRKDSRVTRTAWSGSSYGSAYGGSTTYGASSQTAKPQAKGGFVYGGVGRAVKPTAGAGGKDLSVFRTGVKVRHPKFGEGMIVNVRGTGSNMIVDIAFEGGFGIKQLSASLAPLTVL